MSDKFDEVTAGDGYLLVIEGHTFATFRYGYSSLRYILPYALHY